MADEFRVAVRNVLEKFESATETFLEVAVADSLRSVTTEIQPSGQSDRDIWWAESAAMSFYRRADGEASVWGTTYAPMMSATKEDGTPFYAPDIAEANSETIEYWKGRSRESKQPILRARYSDLVWDFARAVAGQKPDVSFARMAIDAYIDGAKLSYKLVVQPIHYLERALELAISIGNDVLADSNVKEVLGNDTILYLQIFLNDPRGQNLRNRVSHGLTEKRYLTKPLADRVFHVLLALNLIRRKEAPTTGG